jgi:nitroreductase
MAFLELVRKRRSCRKYSTRLVPRDAVDRCLEAARLAPSACNAQPWYFIVVDDEDLRREFADKAFSGVYAMNSFAKEAPVLIAVVTERTSYIARLGGYFKGIQYSLIDIGISCEHLVLQAEEEGLGTCWLGWFNEKAVKKTLGLPRGKKIDVIISMGYPEKEEARDKARRSLNEIREFKTP